MNKYIHLFSLLFCSLVTIGLYGQEEDFRKQAPKPGPAPSIEFGEYEQFKLDNGLQVIVVENHKLPRVSFQLLIDVPPIKEGEYVGTADLAGEMLSRGTASQSKAEIDETIDYIGANFSTSSTGITASCLTKHQDKLLEIMADVLYHPAFAEEEFEKVQTQRLSELSLGQSNADFIARNVGQVLRYDEHPYGEILTKKSLKNITVGQCKEYYSAFFKPNIAYLAIIGDTNLEEAKQIAQKYFAKWEKGTVEKEFHARPLPPIESEVDFVHKDGAVQSVINITYPVNLKPGTEESVVANVLNTMLGGGMLNSRLNKNIREDKGYSYGVRSTLRYDKYVGYFSAGGSVRNEVTDSAIVEFLAEMERLTQEAVPAEELKSVKNYIFGSFARSLERPETVAQYALNTARYKLPSDFYPDYLKKVSKVTAEDVKTMAQKYILPERSHILVVGNMGEVADKLNRFDAKGKVHFYDLDGQAIKDENTEIPEGVTAESVITDYINAIGGKDRLTDVKDATIELTTSVQGMNLDMTMMRKSPDKMLIKVDMNGMTVNETKFDGKKGYASAMGQKQEMGEESIEEMKLQAPIFPELDYLGADYKTELIGIETIDGSRAYHLQVTSPGGKTADIYYDLENKLKVKTVAKQSNGNGGEAAVTATMADYREVEGIKVPYELTSAGVAPFPITLKVASVSFNNGLDASLFEINE